MEQNCPMDRNYSTSKVDNTTSIKATYFNLLIKLLILLCLGKINIYLGYQLIFTIKSILKRAIVIYTPQPHGV